MNRIKSLFVSAYITFLVVAFGWSGYQLWHTNDMSYVALLVASAPGLFFFVHLFLTSTARTSHSLLHIQIPTFLGLVASLWVGEWVVKIVALFVTAGLLAYVYWYSRLGRGHSVVLEKGKRLPELSFETAGGQTVSLTDFRGQPVLMMFYRGNWCPLCMAQIREVAKGYQALKERGVNLLMISSQSHNQTLKLADKFDAPLEFLVDKNNQVADALGIAHKAGLPSGLQAAGYDSDTVYPTVILADADGKVIAADQTDNYRLRPEPETFLRWLDQTV
ncbi:peroxiredoxin family protein [Parendozoicomonas sp. Alg238-R29]|uniref:peroxiredoxin family protein n=1 Tax=Parendozoicomonas sp. Alg238-R29 TaxID=2993446 RepID=UPI00248D7244|nr:peroxiredoxin family protein [Parendozoicomonas sp. Alg238-R29]